MATPSTALAYSVNLDTSSLAGSAGRLEFVLLDGDAVANNSVVISNIVSDGTFIGSDCSVGCAGGPPFTLDDGLGLAQLLYDLTLGTSVSFDLSYTTAYAGIPGTDPPDRFALSLLDSGTNFTLVRTDLLFPADALLTIDLIGSGVVEIAGVTDPSVAVTAIPEPPVVALMVAGLFALAGRRAFVSRGGPSAMQRRTQ